MGGAAVQEIISSYIKIHEDDILPAYIKAHGIEEKVLARGQENAKRETALEMLKDGFSPDKIARYVQKPIEWVQAQTN